MGNDGIHRVSRTRGLNRHTRTAPLGEGPYTETMPVDGSDSTTSRSDASQQDRATQPHQHDTVVSQGRRARYAALLDAGDPGGDGALAKPSRDATSVGRNPLVAGIPESLNPEELLDSVRVYAQTHPVEAAREPVEGQRLQPAEIELLGELFRDDLRLANEELERIAEINRRLDGAGRSDDETPSQSAQPRAPVAERTHALRQRLIQDHPAVLLNVLDQGRLDVGTRQRVATMLYEQPGSRSILLEALLEQRLKPTTRQAVADLIAASPEPHPEALMVVLNTPDLRPATYEAVAALLGDAAPTLTAHLDSPGVTGPGQDAGLQGARAGAGQQSDRSEARAPAQGPTQPPEPTDGMSPEEAASWLTVLQTAGLDAGAYQAALGALVGRSLPVFVEFAQQDGLAEGLTPLAEQTVATEAELSGCKWVLAQQGLPEWIYRGAARRLLTPSQAPELLARLRASGLAEDARRPLTDALRVTDDRDTLSTVLRCPGLRRPMYTIAAERMLALPDAAPQGLIDVLVSEMLSRKHYQQAAERLVRRMRPDDLIKALARGLFPTATRAALTALGQHARLVEELTAALEQVCQDPRKREPRLLRLLGELDRLHERLSRQNRLALRRALEQLLRTDGHHPRAYRRAARLLAARHGAARLEALRNSVSHSAIVAVMTEIARHCDTRARLLGRGVRKLLGGSSASPRPARRGKTRQDADSSDEEPEAG